MFRIGSGAGFSGDRTDAAEPVVDAIVASGAGGALIFETIGERTLALGHVARSLDPGKGYEPLLEQMLRPVLKKCVDAGIVIVGNFGCANPPAAALAIARLAEELDIPDLRIALIEGDDVSATVSLPDTEPLGENGGQSFDKQEAIACNVYIGATAIGDAIRQGAQVVVAGRVADPALALGPLMAHFRWQTDDWNRLSAGVLVGHLLECGAQVTGGYFADPGWKDVPDLDNIGFPIAEVSEDGSFVLTKPENTGGIVDLRTVKEQILYEIHDPAAYLTSDVTLDITDVRLEQVSPNRVRISGARGHPPPDMLKATLSFAGDWIGEAEISYGGPNCIGRARQAADVVSRRLSRRRIDVEYRHDIIGLTSLFSSGTGEECEGREPHDVRARFGFASSRRAAVEAAVQEVKALYCCGPAGGGGVRHSIQARVRTTSRLVNRSLVQERFRFWEAAHG